MNREEFFLKFAFVLDTKDVKRISHAYWLAKEVHRNQKRDGGERYFEHCRRVACLLLEYQSMGFISGPTLLECVELGIDANEIIVALLHDCIEDGFIPGDFMETLFGKVIAEAVRLLSNIVPYYDDVNGVKEKRRKTEKAYYRGIMNAPLLVRRVKLADRLDNLRDMKPWSTKRKQKYIAETKKYILPIARITNKRFLNALEQEIRIIDDE